MRVRVRVRADRPRGVDALLGHGRDALLAAALEVFVEGGVVRPQLQDVPVGRRRRDHVLHRVRVRVRVS